MSWDLSIVVPGCSSCGRGEEEVYERNYTHNCNAMIRAASIAPFELPAWTPATFGEVILRKPTVGECWGDYNGKLAREAGEFASRIAAELERDPEKYRPMQPENGWGSYATVIDLCRAVSAACAEYPEGRFEAHG